MTLHLLKTNEKTKKTNKQTIDNATNLERHLFQQKILSVKHRGAVTKSGNKTHSPLFLQIGNKTSNCRTSEYCMMKLDPFFMLFFYSSTCSTYNKTKFITNHISTGNVANDTTFIMFLIISI